MLSLSWPSILNVSRRSHHPTEALLSLYYSPLNSTTIDPLQSPTVIPQTVDDNWCIGLCFMSLPKSFPAQLKFREKGSEIFPGSVKALRKGKRKFSRLSLNFVKKKAKSFSITIDTNRLRGHRRILVVLRHNLPAPPTRGSQCFG